MKLNDTAYEILKWIALICIPALSVFVQTIGPAVNIPNVDTVVLVLNATGVLIGTLIGASTYNFRQENIIYTEPKGETHAE